MFGKKKTEEKEVRYEASGEKQGKVKEYLSSMSHLSKFVIEKKKRW